MFQLVVMSSFVFLDVCLIRDSWEQVLLQSNIEQHLSNLGMVKALDVRCVHRTISRTTLLSTACLVQKGARHLMGPPHMQVANVKLASSSKRMESGSLMEKEVWLRVEFSHAVLSRLVFGCLAKFAWIHILKSVRSSKALWMSSSSSTFGRELLTLCGSTLGLFIGFARVGNENRSFRCLSPEQRCHSVQSFKMSKSACADGYVGVMCMDCASNFYAAGRACKECQDYDLEFPNPWLVAPVIVIVVVVLALWLWRRRNTEPEVQQVRCKSFFTELKDQIQAQGPILLQHCRWAMLTLSFCLFHFSDYFYTISLNPEIFFIDFILFRNSKVNFGEFLQPCKRPLLPHLPGRSHTLRPFSSHSRVWRELWTFNASSTLGLEMHSWHHEMASCKFQIVRRFLPLWFEWLWMFSKFEWDLVLIAPTHAGWTYGSLGFCPHGSGRPAFGDIVLPDFGNFFHWIGYQCNAQGLRILSFFLIKSRYAGKDCSTEQEKCPSDFFKIFVRVGEKQRICS